MYRLQYARFYIHFQFSMINYETQFLTPRERTFTSPPFSQFRYTGTKIPEK
jgi:hypothetical protein